MNNSSVIHPIGRCFVACQEGARFKGWVLREFIQRDGVVSQIKKILGF